MRLTAIYGGLLLLFISIGIVQAGPENPNRLDSASVAAPPFDYDLALKTSQQALGNQVGNYAFTNAKGNRVTLSDFRGKPLVISMVFTSCYQICPMTTRHLSKVVEKARDALGHDSFSVAVIGFDSEVDTPDAMQYFANKQGVAGKDWNLLSIAAEEVDSLSRDIGFIYFPSSNGFDHIIQATIIDAQGEVYRQVYGQVFETPLLVDPLLELVLGRPAPEQSFLTSLGDKIKLFCTTYDPVRDAYFFDYSLFVGMLIGGSIILIAGIAMWREHRKGMRPSDS